MSDSAQATTKVALVTGGSRGIGRACALALADAGFDIALNYVANQAAAQSVQADIEAKGRRVLLLQADVSVSQQAAGLVSSVVDQWGRLDALVNNAGITRDTLLVRMSDEQWDAVIRTNLNGVFYTSRAAAKTLMKQRSGHIVNLTSIIGQLGNVGQANYAAAKAGVIGLTKSLAKELASRNVTVNAVAPGFIETDMTHEVASRDQLLQHIPLQRFGQPEDVANAVVFLVTSAPYITGQVLQVSGGLVF